MINYISTISKHLLEKSRVICRLHGSCDMTAHRHLQPMFSSAFITAQGAAGKVTGPGCGAALSPAGRRGLVQPHRLRGGLLARVLGQNRFRRGAEVTTAARVDLLQERACRELTARVLKVCH